MPRLDYLTIDTTGHCDLKCPGMCYYNPGIDLRGVAVDSAILERVIDEAVRDLALRSLVFAGKEPFLDPFALFHLLAYASRYSDLTVGIVTNGRHIARHWDALHRAAEAKQLSFLDISLDAGDAATHDRIRGRLGTFDRASEAVARCGAELPTVRVGVSSVLRHDNEDGILNLLQRASAFCQSFFITPVQPPPFSSMAAPTWDAIERFLGRLEEVLATLDRGPIEVIFALHGVYVYDAVCSGVIDPERLDEDDHGQVVAVRRLGDHTLIHHCMVLPETGWRIARVTWDGAWLPNSHYLQAPSPASFAVGQIRDASARDLYARAIGPDGVFAGLLASRTGHDCRTMPCWPACFGGFTVADTEAVAERSLSHKPALCLKTIFS